MSCEFCNGNKSLIDTNTRLSRKGDFYPGVDVCIECNVLYVAAIADVYEPNYTEAEVKINFCPMCGEKLPE